jgi:nicotinate-nucleotide adenylyltransferase
MSKVGVLTGTFDPVHLGHLELAAAAITTLGLDEVWFMVNAHSRVSESYKDAVSYKDRVGVVRLATRDRVDMQVYSGPLALRPHNIQTFTQLMQDYPKNEFVFITGMDTIARLDRWEGLESIVRNTTFAIAHRSGTSIQTLEDLKSRLKQVGLELRAEVFEIQKHADASSTEIRQELEMARAPQQLDPKVYDYIKSHELYPKR